MSRARHTAPRQRDLSRQRSTRRTRPAAPSPSPTAPATIARPRANLGVPTPRTVASATAADVPRFKQMFVFHPYDYAIQSIDWERRVRREWRKIPTDQHPPITDVELLAHLNQRESVAVYAAKREREKNGTTQRFSTTRHLLIDLDLGNGHEDVLARAAGERKALGAPTFALSSPGGGVHRIPRRHGSLPRGSLISRAGERVPATIRPRRVSARSGQSEH